MDAIPAEELVILKTRQEGKFSNSSCGLCISFEIAVCSLETIFGANKSILNLYCSITKELRTGQSTKP